MRYVSFYDSRDAAQPGLVRDDLVHRIDLPSLRDYIALDPRQRAKYQTQETISLDGLRLAPPVIPARNVLCVGRNYLEHAKEGARAFGSELKLPDLPTFFTKAPTAIAGPGQELHLQADVSAEYDFEAELGVVIGQKCKNVAEANALDVIFGYTCVNDVTARDRQRAHGQWFKGKSLDHTCPIGPWIVSSDEVGDAQQLKIGIAIDGVRKQDSSTSQMIFSIRRIVAELSKGMTLLPGDVIATGTPEGVGFARTPPEFLVDGTAMTVTIEKIGSLSNVVRIA